MKGLVSLGIERTATPKWGINPRKLRSINGLIGHFRSLERMERLAMREGNLSFWFGRVDVFRDPKNSRMLFAITIEANKDLLSDQELAQLDEAPLREKACGTLIKKAQERYPDLAITKVNDKFPIKDDADEGVPRRALRKGLYDLMLSVNLK